MTPTALEREYQPENHGHRPSRAPSPPLPLWVLLAGFVVAAIVLAGVHPDNAYNPTGLFTAANIVFLTVVSLFVAVLAARDYLSGGRDGVLLMGCGSLALGLSALIAAIHAGGPGTNPIPATYNTGALIAGLCFTAAAVVAQTAFHYAAPRMRMRVLDISYGATVILILLVIVLIRTGNWPLHFVQGSGATLFGSVIARLAAFLFVAAALGMSLVPGKTDVALRRWYTIGLASIGIGLAAVSFQHALGDPLNWLGRACQYIGCVVIFVGLALTAGWRGSWAMPLQRALQESRATYRNLVDLSPDGILMVVDNQVVFANPAAALLLAVTSPERLEGVRLASLVEREERSLLEERLNQVLGGAVSHPRETRLVRRDGSVMLAEVAAARAEFGGRPAAQLLLHDVTERKQAEEALQRSEERYRALALENERLYRQQLQIAESLQGALLHIPSQLGPLRLGHLYRSATEAARVGGDFYDVFEAKDGKIVVLIGDVSGHGIEAARMAALTKDVIHAFAHQTLLPQHILRRTNGLLLEKATTGFVTLFLGILDPETLELRYASAGHPETLLRRVSGEIQALGSGSPPLGVFPEAVWKPGEVPLHAGDILLLYTDGVIEARHDGDFFGEKRLRRFLERKRISVERLPALILDRVLAFSGGSLRDDLAILTVLLTDEHPGGRTEPLYRQERLLD